MFCPCGSSTCTCASFSGDFSSAVSMGLHLWPTHPQDLDRGYTGRGGFATTPLPSQQVQRQELRGRGDRKVGSGAPVGIKPLKELQLQYKVSNLSFFELLSLWALHIWYLPRSTPIMEEGAEKTSSEQFGEWPYQRLRLIWRQA